VRSPEPTRPSLIARLKDPADAAAWSEFQELYGELILSHCRRRGLQTVDAEDVRQLVLLSLMNAVRTFAYDPARGRFRDYLGRIVHNAVGRLRSRHPSPLPGLEGLDIVVVDEHAEIDAQWESDWVEHHLRRALKEVGRTSDPESLAVFRQILSGASAPEAAQASRKSVDAVHKIVQRMRDRLREQVTLQLREEDPEARIDGHDRG
jgi:RNA polymerase sigma factor (sigma-70 family)